ncbi:DUF4333 domain-containing protein, partial [Saccharomonospora iraqiensis]|uniref:DUF4333 domain-containing protein n=1 Tax=Saccharomonospora iraqiensis TaxID=52698 RepID=UPI00022E00CD
PQGGPQQWGGPQPYGQTPYGPYGGQPPGGSSGGPGKGLWIGIGALVVALGVAAVVLFVWPGVLNTTVFDHEQMAGDVQEVLTDGYGLPNVGEVTCPADQEVAADTTFTCDATVDGAPHTVEITVTDADNAEYRVGQPQPAR